MPCARIPHHASHPTLRPSPWPPPPRCCWSSRNTPPRWTSTLCGGQCAPSATAPSPSRPPPSGEAQGGWSVGPLPAFAALASAVQSSVGRCGTSSRLACDCNQSQAKVTVPAPLCFIQLQVHQRAAGADPDQGELRGAGGHRGHQGHLQVGAVVVGATRTCRRCCCCRRCVSVTALLLLLHPPLLAPPTAAAAAGMANRSSLPPSLPSAMRAAGGTPTATSPSSARCATAWSRWTSLRPRPAWCGSSASTRSASTTQVGRGQHL